MSNTESVADDLLRSGYERWLRIEEAKADLASDSKELFAELKGQGFDSKALRESFRHVRDAASADKQEHDAIVDLYVASLTRDTRMRAHVENIEKFDPETGELQSEPAIAGPCTELVTRSADESVISGEAAEPALPAPIPPSAPAETRRIDAPAEPASDTGSAPNPRTTVTRPRGCQHPDACASMNWRELCWSCGKAAAPAREEA